MTNFELFKDSAAELIFLDNSFTYRSDMWHRNSSATIHFDEDDSYTFGVCEAVAVPSREWMSEHKERIINMIIRYFEENDSKFKAFIRYTYKLHPTKMKAMGFTLLEGK